MRPATLVAAAVLLGTLPAGCDCSGSAGDIPPCQRADPPPECSAACVAGDPCGSGFFCGDAGTCTAECSFGSDVGRGGCMENYICTLDGMCTFSDGSDGGGCADVTLQTMPTTPTVMVLIDQSASMTDAFDYADRWTVLRDTLTDPTGLFYSLENVVRFGAALYSAMDGGAICPMVTTIPPALNNAAAIDAVYSGASVIEDTPTGESIEAITFNTVAGGFDFVAYPEPGPKIIIVATDGEPDTCAVPDPQNGQPEAVAAAMAAHAAGIDVYMIGIDFGSVTAGHLQDMANAGVGYPVGGAVNAPYYEVGTQADLIMALSNIVGGVISCTLDLNGDIDAAMAGTGYVTLDGLPISFGDPNGWTVVDSDTIILVGDSCTTLSDGGVHTVDATFPCNVIL